MNGEDGKGGLGRGRYGERLHSFSKEKKRTICTTGARRDFLCNDHLQKTFFITVVCTSKEREENRLLMHRKERRHLNGFLLLQFLVCPSVTVTTYYAVVLVFQFSISFSVTSVNVTLRVCLFLISQSCTSFLCTEANFAYCLKKKKNIFFYREKPLSRTSCA